MLSMDKISGPHQLFKVPGLHLLARHDLLDRGEFQNYSQNGSHGAMIPTRLIIEDKVLKFSPLNGHKHGAMGSGDRSDHAHLPESETDAAVGTRPYADAATQTEGLVDPRLSARGLMRVACRHESHGLHWTGRYAFATAVARIRTDFRQEVRGGDGV